MTRSQIEALADGAVWAFYEAFRRRPTAHEQKLIVAALTRFIVEPSAPTHRLQ